MRPLQSRVRGVFRWSPAPSTSAVLAAPDDVTNVNEGVCLRRRGDIWPSPALATRVVDFARCRARLHDSHTPTGNAPVEMNFCNAAVTFPIAASNLPEFRFGTDEEVWSRNTQPPPGSHWLRRRR